MWVPIDMFSLCKYSGIAPCNQLKDMFLGSSPSVSSDRHDFVQLLGNHGPLTQREAGQVFEKPAREYKKPVSAKD
jgi:hypothetical protein